MSSLKWFALSLSAKYLKMENIDLVRSFMYWQWIELKNIFINRYYTIFILCAYRFCIVQLQDFILIIYQWAGSSDSEPQHKNSTHFINYKLYLRSTHTLSIFLASDFRIAMLIASVILPHSFTRISSSKRRIIESSSATFPHSVNCC